MSSAITPVEGSYSAPAVVHTLKSVRKHHIDIKLPPPAAENEHAMVLNLPGYSREFTYRDFEQLVGVLVQARNDIMGDAGT